MSIKMEITKKLNESGAWLIDSKDLKQLPEVIQSELKSQQQQADLVAVSTLSLVPQKLVVSARPKSNTALSVRRLYGRVGAASLTQDQLQWSLPSKIKSDHLTMALIGMSQGAYTFERYKSQPRKTLKQIKVVASGAIKANDKKAIEEAQVHADSVWLCRDLINTPAEDMGPDQFVEVAKKVAKESGLKIKVMLEDECHKAGMGALIGVGRASHRRPRLLILEWNGSKNKNFTALCGKGVCFDTGGLDIKPSQSMLLMRKDMGGAATVLSSMRSLALLKAKKHIKAYIPLVENAIGPDAFRPGDILKVSDGQTVEVGNTDAEGRLVLADAMAYAKKQGAKEIITVATLTGAAMVALGRIHVPIMGDQNLVNHLCRAAEVTGEKVWQLPMDEEHKQMVKGKMADLTNSDGTGEAGCITAGAFLWSFAGDLPFLHCDISPASWKMAAHDLGPAGATGVLVTSLTEALRK